MDKRIISTDKINHPSDERVRLEDREGVTEDNCLGAIRKLESLVNHGAKNSTKTNPLELRNCNKEQIKNTNTVSLISDRPIDVEIGSADEIEERIARICEALQGTKKALRESES
ncbi:unnamed protein product [Arabidopsis halleri]